MSPPVIRLAEPADLDALDRLEQIVFQGDQLSRRSLRYYIASSTAAVLVLLMDDEPVGDAIVAFRAGSTLARLYSIAIAPDHVGRRLGAVLLDRCEEIARERGSSRLRLEVRADNSGAIRLYERAGYQAFGTYPDYYEDGAAALRFEKRLG